MRSVPAGGRAAWRQEPKVMRRAGPPLAAAEPGLAVDGVVMVLAGNGLSGSGQTWTPSSRTSYAVVEPGVRPVTVTRA